MAGATIRLNKDVVPVAPANVLIYDDNGYLIGYENPRNGKVTFFPASDWVTGVTASTSSDQAGGYAVQYKNVHVGTVGTAGDSLTLPFGQEGMSLTIVNGAAANSMDVFPASGEAINALSGDAAFAIAANKAVQFTFTGGRWFTNLTA